MTAVHSIVNRVELCTSYSPSILHVILYVMASNRRLLCAPLESCPLDRVELSELELRIAHASILAVLCGGEQ